jgi:hypothetical protein
VPVTLDLGQSVTFPGCLYYTFLIAAWLRKILPRSSVGEFHYHGTHELSKPSSNTHPLR